MIERYTRPELGAIWTDEARMEAWREVEVAACEELPFLLGAGNGPTDADLERSAGRRSPWRRSTSTSSRPTTTWRRSSTCSPPQRRGGALDPLRLTSSDVLDTALALQLKAAGEAIVPAPARSAQALVARAREHVQTLCVGARTGCTPSRQPSA